MRYFYESDHGWIETNEQDYKTCLKMLTYHIAYGGVPFDTRLVAIDDSPKQKYCYIKRDGVWYDLIDENSGKRLYSVREMEYGKQYLLLKQWAESREYQIRRRHGKGH